MMLRQLYLGLLDLEIHGAQPPSDAAVGKGQMGSALMGSGSGSGPGRVTRCLGPRADSGRTTKTRHNNLVRSLTALMGSL